MAPFPHRYVLHRSVLRPDPHLGHRFRPHLDVHVAHESAAYRLRTNAQGFRDDRDHGPKRPGIPKIVVLGDSFTAGDGVNNEARWTDHLAEALGADVCNLAISGGAPDQNVLLAEQLAPHEGADLIIWAIASHTIRRIQQAARWSVAADGVLERVERPHFVFERDTLRLRGVPCIAAARERREVTVPELETGIGAGIQGALDRVRCALGRSLRRTVLPLVEPDYEDVTSDGWRLMTALVERCRSACTGVPLVVVPLPTKAHLEGEMRPIYQERFASLDAPVRELHVLNVTDPMIAAEPLTRRLYSFQSSGHYTEAGHRAVACAIRNGLRRRGLIPGAACNQSTPSPPKPRAKSDEPLDLVLSWDAEDSFAELRSSRSGATVARAYESSFAAGRGYAGAVPLTAVALCLEQAGVDASVLSRVILESPSWVLSCGKEAGPLDAWLPIAAAWVRWLGAAEVDTRAVHCFEGPVVHGLGALPTASGTSGPPGTHRSGHAPEDTWLEKRLRRIYRTRRPERRARALVTLAARWEQATRAARFSALPVPIPRTFRRNRFTSVARPTQLRTPLTHLLPLPIRPVPEPLLP